MTPILSYELKPIFQAVLNNDNVVMNKSAVNIRKYVNSVRHNIAQKIETLDRVCIQTADDRRFFDIYSTRIVCYDTVERAFDIRVLIKVSPFTDIDCVYFQKSTVQDIPCSVDDLHLMYQISQKLIPEIVPDDEE